MADLRASASNGTLPTQSTLELQQKLDKALSDNASLRTQLGKCEEDLASVRAQLTAQDNARSVHLATIERQLTEAVEARDSGVQILKQKCDEIEKLKMFIRGEEMESFVDVGGEELCANKELLHAGWSVR